MLCTFPKQDLNPESSKPWPVPSISCPPHPRLDQTSGYLGGLIICLPLKPIHVCNLFQVNLEEGSSSVCRNCRDEPSSPQPSGPLSTTEGLGSTGPAVPEDAVPRSLVEF